MKFVVFYLKTRYETVTADSVEEAVKIVKNSLTSDCKILGGYPFGVNPPPGFEDFPRPPRPPAKAVA